MNVAQKTKAYGKKLNIEPAVWSLGWEELTAHFGIS